MQDRIINRRRVRAALRIALTAGGLLAGALLAGCSAIGDGPATIFADPGKYQYNTCEQIAGQRKTWQTREQELRLLMDKADHVAATEELKVLESTARAKNCDNPANWKSNSSVR